MALGDIWSVGTLSEPDAYRITSSSTFVMSDSLVVSNAASETLGFHDDVFRVVDPADVTKVVRFDVGTVPTATAVAVAADLLVRKTTVTISTTEVLALNATPITLVAAAGADTFIEFVSAHIFMDYATTAYDNVATGEDLIISYTNGSGEEVARVETTGFLDQSADAHRLVLAQSPAQDSATTIIPVANAALVISLLVGEIKTGDSPIIVETLYRLRKLAIS